MVNRKKKKKRKVKQNKSYYNAGWITYSRCFLVTLGLLFIVLPFWFMDKIWGQNISVWLYGLVACFVFFGLITTGVAFWGNEKVVDKWADSSSTHEASVLVMVVAAPLYFILKAIEKK